MPFMNFGTLQSRRKDRYSMDTTATWLSQLLATNRTAAWLSDQASYFTLTGDDVDAWLEAGGDTNLDLSYVTTEYKAKRDTTYPVNTSTATVRDLGFFLSRYQAGSAGKSSRIWPGGVGSYFVVVKINGAVSDGAWGSNDGIIRHGDTTAWGGILQIAGRMGGGGYRVRHTWWDGAIKTVDYNVAGTVLPGWHLISFRADGASISLEVDDLGEVSVPAGAMTYVDGVLRVMSPYSTGQDVAIAAIVAYSAFDDTTRNTVKAQLQSLITDLP